MKIFFILIVKLLLYVARPIISEKLINLVLREFNGINRKSFYTYHARPQRAEDYHYDEYRLSNLPKTKLSIIIQGPLKIDNEYTINTIKLYMKNYPEALIILSTWDGAEVDLPETRKFKILKNKLPKNYGALNFNLQKQSTLSGLRLASELGYDFAIKTRTDQRLCAPNLDLLLRTYLMNQIAHDGRPRIIESSVNICKYRPYSMCDVFQYSSTEELIKMWDIPDDDRAFTAAELSMQNPSPIDMYNADVAEIRLHKLYAMNRGHEPTHDLSNYHRFITDYFIVIDKELLDLHFYKYKASEYDLSMNPLYKKGRILSRFTHSDWVLSREYGCEILSSTVRLDLPEKADVV